MAKPGKEDVIPARCKRCGGEKFKHDEFSMHGKLGFMGPDYRFDVYICESCNKTEFFFQSAKWIM